MIRAREVTAEIYRLLHEPIDPLERRNQIEQLVHNALDGTIRTFESRIAALEEVAHTPFDFSDLIRRIEHLEFAAGGQPGLVPAVQAARPSEGPAGGAAARGSKQPREAR